MTIESLTGTAKLLKIFLGESDHWHGKPLYEAIVMEARSHGIAGATVIRGILSFGANKHWHSFKLLELSNDMPIVIEIVDREEKIHQFLKVIDPMLSGQGCLVTLERVEIYRHQPNQHVPNE